MDTNSNNHPIYRNHSIFIYLVAVLIAFLLGQQVVIEAASLFAKNIWLYSIGSVLGGYIVGVLVYEFGKLIFGKIAGYRLVKFNLFGLSFTKGKEKTRVSFEGFEGFGGKVLMAPKKDNANSTLLLLGGTIFSVIFAVGAIIGGYIFSNSLPNVEVVFYVILLICVAILLVVILNAAPFLSDDIGDGFIFRLIHTKVVGKNDFHHLLRQQEALLTGKGELSLYECDFANPVNSQILLYNCYYYLDHDDEYSAKEIIKKAFELKEHLTEQDLSLFYSIHYYFILSNEVNEKITDEYWGLEKSVRKVISGGNRFDTLKSALLVAAFIELSYDSYEYLTLKIEKLKNKYSPLRAEKEDELIEKVLNIIEKKKPEWFQAYENEE